jgi:hypothetical protein
MLGCRSDAGGLWRLGETAALDEKRRSALHGKRRFPRDTARAMSQENVLIWRGSKDRRERPKPVRATLMRMLPGR